MQVVKVLNNSLVLALDEQGQELILMGKGIGFHKSLGQTIAEAEIEKVFVLREREVSRSIIRLAAETDSIFFELAQNIIAYASQTYGMVLSEHIYMSLPDHISFVVQRFKSGIVLRNFYTQELRRFNSDEFAVGEYAVQLINAQLKLEIAPEEAGNIAFHFINAQTERASSHQEENIRQFTNDIVNIVRYSSDLSCDDTSIAYGKFVAHVQLFAKRLLEHDLGESKAEDQLYRDILKRCVSEEACVQRIRLYIRKKFGLELPDEERLYLLLHIHRIREAVKKGWTNQ